MDNDDAMVGRVLGRREALRLLALSGAAVAAGCSGGAGGSGGTSSAAGEVAAGAGATTAGATSAASAALPACVVKPELTVGPYFVDKQANRSDIRGDPTSGATKAGVPLALAFAVSRIANGRCAPLAGAMVDVWQCDAEGQYSGVNDRMVGFNTEGQQFLRGYQVTDANGLARFTTIYPGWYQGRTVHIHFKVRAPGAAANETYEFTSQLFFDEATTDRVHAQQPYAKKGQRDLRNADDGIYQESKGQLLLAVAPEGAGYRADFALGLDLSDTRTGQSDRMGGPGGPGGRRGPPGGPPPGGRRPPPGAPPSGA